MLITTNYDRMFVCFAELCYSYTISHSELNWCFTTTKTFKKIHDVESPSIEDNTGTHLRVLYACEDEYCYMTF